MVIKSLMKTRVVKLWLMGCIMFSTHSLFASGTFMSWPMPGRTASADPVSGEITLAWDLLENIAEENNHSEVRFAELDDDCNFSQELTFVVKRKVKNYTGDVIPTGFFDDAEVIGRTHDTSYIDKTFGEVPGYEKIMYQVKAIGKCRGAYEGETWTVTAVIEARRTMCLAYGLGSFDDGVVIQSIDGNPLKYPVNMPKGHAHAADEAEKVCDLIKANEGDTCLAVARGSYDASCGKEGFTNSFEKYSFQGNPGDVVLFYLATHGSQNGFFLVDGFCSIKEFANCIRKFKGKGVRFIGIINACYSGALIEQFKSNEFDYTAWIASCREQEVSACVDYEPPSKSVSFSGFQRTFLEWGWELGFGKLDSVVTLDGKRVDTGAKSGEYLNLYEAAHYADLIFPGASSVCGQHFAYVREDVLKKIAIKKMNTISEGIIPVRPNKPGLEVNESNKTLEIIINSSSDSGICAVFAVDPSTILTSDPIQWGLNARTFLTHVQFRVLNPDKDIRDWVLPFIHDSKKGGAREYSILCRSLGTGGWSEVSDATTWIPPNDIEWFKELLLRKKTRTVLNRTESVDIQSVSTTKSAKYNSHQIVIETTPPTQYMSDIAVSVQIKGDDVGLAIGYFLASVSADDEECSLSVQIPADFLTYLVDDVNPSDLEVDFGPNRVEGSWGGCNFVGMSTVKYETISSAVYDENPYESYFAPVPCHGVEEPNTDCSVSYIMNGGINSLANPHSFTTNDLPIELKIPKRTGYVFKGWTPNDGRIDEGTDTNCTFTAQWERMQLTIMLDANDGMTPIRQIVKNYGEKYGDALPTLTRKGYIFLGWYAEGTSSDDYDAPITADSIVRTSGVLHAEWYYAGAGGGDNPFMYECTATFDANGGTCSETNRVVEYGKAIGALPTPVLTGYKFLGWFTEREGGQKVSSSTKVYWDTTYYAHWEYTGSVMVAAAVAEGCAAMGKVSGGGKPVKAGTKVTLKATANKGYVFVEWRDGAGVVLTQSASCTYVAADKDVTLTAVFVTTAEDAGSLKVTVDDMSTEADGTIALDLGACVESLSQPKLAVAGLPSGVKFDAKTGKISGKATKPGVYTVKVTATNASATGKNAVVETFNVTVPNFKWDEDAVGVALEDRYLLQAGVTPVLSNEIAAITGGGWKLAVSGLPSGVKFDAKKGLFTGVATKEGFYTVYFTATRGSGKTAEKQVATATFEVVFPTLTLDIAAFGDESATNKCKVAGGGKYPFGKKVTLKATPDKGKAFMGWYDGEGELVAQTMSYSYVTTAEGVTFTAMFVTADEDKASIALGLNGEEMAAAGAGRPPYRTNVWCGVYLEWPVAASALSEPKVKVAGLPSGLKFTDKPVTSKIGTGKTAVTITNVPANTIYGAPTAASKMDKGGNPTPSAVKFTVTTAGKSTQTYQIDTVVDALPTWAQGTFAGGLTDGGQVSLTVSAAGKTSGKALGDGLTYTLAAPYYAGFEMTDGVSNFLADVTASWSYKEGTKTIKTNDVVEVVVQDNGIGGYAVAEDWFEAYTVNWKVEPWKTLGKSFDKKTFAYAILPDGSFSEDEDVLTSALGEEVVGRVTLKFAATGAVSVAGEFVTGYDEKKEKYTTVKVSGSATLVPVDDERGAVFIYLTPKGLTPHARCMEVLLPQD